MVLNLLRKEIHTFWSGMKFVTSAGFRLREALSYIKPRGAFFFKLHQMFLDDKQQHQYYTTSGNLIGLPEVKMSIKANLGSS